MTAQIIATFTDEQGREILQYATGVQKIKATGHLLRGPDSALITTSERARELVARRVQIGRERATEGIDEAAVEMGIMPMNKAGSGESWKLLNKRGFTIAHNADNARNFSQLLETIGKTTGYTAPERERDANSEPATTTNILVIDADVRRALEMLQDLQKKQADNAERK
jgi:hypothetical protein